MSGTSEDGDISFYEELGVGNHASPEEIRNSFRALARMLHPDQQTDPQLKEAAERQMRKLNRVYAVISDPERRLRYDELLQDEYPHLVELPAEDKLSRRRSRAAWAAAALVGAALVLWFGLARGPDRMAARTPPARGNAAEVAGLRADLRAVAAERDAAIRELVRLRGSGTAAAPPTLPSTKAPPALAELPALTELSPAPQRSAATARPVRSGLAGFWLYVKPPPGQQNKNREIYPPEFIEATITEANGVMQGKYRSRLQIVDRAISPDVNFSFSGPVDAATPSYQWTGPGGAKGEVTLRLIADNQLRVDWTARELGSQQGLASGTAVLKRRVE